MDIKIAYLHGDMEQEIFIKQLPSFESKEFPDHVHRLEKVFYGLQQDPMAWYDSMTLYHIQYSYKKGPINNNLFIKKSGTDLILTQVYVDDIIYGSKSEHLSKEFAKVVPKKFEISMMGELTFFLGLKIKQLTKGIFFSMSIYVANMLKLFHSLTASLQRL